MIAEVEPYAYLSEDGKTGAADRVTDFGMFSPQGTEAVAEILTAVLDGVDSVTSLVEQAEALGHGELFDTAVRESVFDAVPDAYRSVIADAWGWDWIPGGGVQTVEAARHLIAGAYIEKGSVADIEAASREKVYEVTVTTTDTRTIRVTAVSPEEARSLAASDEDHLWIPVRPPTTMVKTSEPTLVIP